MEWLQIGVALQDTRKRGFGFVNQLDVKCTSKEELRKQATCNA